LDLAKPRFNDIVLESHSIKRAAWAGKSIAVKATK